VPGRCWSLIAVPSAGEQRRTPVQQHRRTARGVGRSGPALPPTTAHHRHRPYRPAQLHPGGKVGGLARSAPAALTQRKLEMPGLRPRARSRRGPRACVHRARRRCRLVAGWCCRGWWWRGCAGRAGCWTPALVGWSLTGAGVLGLREGDGCGSLSAPAGAGRAVWSQLEVDRLVQSGWTTTTGPPPVGGGPVVG